MAALSSRRSPAQRPFVLVPRGSPLGGRRPPRLRRALTRLGHAPSPLLVVGSAAPRAVRAPIRVGWGEANSNTVWLGAALRGGDGAPRRWAPRARRSSPPSPGRLLERAGGNPLYAEEFVADGWSSAADRPDGAVPETVQALIAGRLDTLAADAKALLHDAAVVGKVFWTGALAVMGDREREDVLTGVRELVRREFVRPARVSSVAGEDEFSFWHVLVRDVAYQQIPRGPRAEKHVRAAEWIEQAAAERVSDHAEILVHHYRQAIELHRAAGGIDCVPELESRLGSYLVLAGDRALHLDIGAAERAYRDALALIPQGATRAAVLVKLADVLQEQGRVVEAEQAYEKAMPELRAAGDDHAAAVAMVGLARSLWRHGDTSRAAMLTREAIPILEQAPGPISCSPTAVRRGKTRWAADRRTRSPGQTRASCSPNARGRERRAPSPVPGHRSHRSPRSRGPRGHVRGA